MGDTGNVKPTPALARKTFCVPYGSKWLAKHNCWIKRSSGMLLLCGWRISEWVVLCDWTVCQSQCYWHDERCVSPKREREFKDTRLSSKVVFCLPLNLPFYSLQVSDWLENVVLGYQFQTVSVLCANGTRPPTPSPEVCFAHETWLKQSLLWGSILIQTLIARMVCWLGTRQTGVHY